MYIHLFSHSQQLKIHRTIHGVVGANNVYAHCKWTIYFIVFYFILCRFIDAFHGWENVKATHFGICL